MSLPHTCGMTVRGASDCPACRSRRSAEAPPPEHWVRVSVDDRGRPKATGLKPYTDEDGRDHNGLLR